MLLRLLTESEARRRRATKLSAQATGGRPRGLGPVASIAVPWAKGSQGAAPFLASRNVRRVGTKVFV
eukprot:3005548-Pyramimonas_sp.AAC.1